MEPGFAAVTERAGNQEFHHDMVLAERIPNGLVIDVGERLERLHDPRADGRLPDVEGAMRLSASRNLSDQSSVISANAPSTSCRFHGSRKRSTNVSS